MRSRIAPFVLFIFTVWIGTTATSYGQPMEETNRTLSPYFFVKSDDPSVDQLPLKSTSAEVNVAGVIADVMVTQVYKNEGRKPLEAIYVFPGIDACRCLRNENDHWKADHYCQYSGKKRGKASIRGGKTTREECIFTGTTKTKCIPDERSQHLAGRCNPGGIEVYRITHSHGWDL